jgi:hypothetical protein
MAAKRRKRTVTRRALESKMGRIQALMRPGIPSHVLTSLERKYHKVEQQWSKKLNEERMAFDKHMSR